MDTYAMILAGYGITVLVGLFVIIWMNGGPLI
jgi:hypothetical protein